ncbi:glycosyltransferase family 4 protein [Patescibacteria group bacterium]|nr:glycosyltransferase family 4 protein [Patescibacteria group bacterium]MBU1953033.1 glycosyltransferase family 4 protein [Patescibacteria group bacterium]
MAITSKKLKVVFVSGMLPNGHYSQYITSGLALNPNIELVVYTDKRQENLDIAGCGTIKPVWSKSWRFFFEILKQLRIDKPNIVHFQHELNMYGGQITAVMFPFLILTARIMGFKVVTTVHATVYKKQVNTKFIETFGYDPDKISPFLVKAFFSYVYFTVTNFSNFNIVHTNLTKQILTQDYGAPAKKIQVIPTAIPKRDMSNATNDHYFFYFGYMVRRKGLGFALEGFKKFSDKHPMSDFKFILAGGVIEGQEQAFEEIKEMVKKYRLENKVEIKGFIKQEMQDDLYTHASAVVIPAILSMGSSGPLFHSNSYHKCVLTSNIGHFLEDIDDNKTGILVENDKWDKAFEYIVDNPQLVAEIEKNVSIKAQSRTPQATAESYYSLYKTLFTERSL